jgi:diguanylate cyclase (GGDEF)-like protein
MKRRIVIAMLVLLAGSAAGTFISIAYVKSSTDVLRRVTEMHRISEMRQHLVLAILRVNTASTDDADVLTDSLDDLERSAANCTTCHHGAEVAARVGRVQELIRGYEAVLSQYVTTSGSPARLARLKADAAGLAEELLRATGEMAKDASRMTSEGSDEAVRRFDEARLILTGTIVVTFLIAAAVAIYLARSVTTPVEQLVRATRAIAAGDLGFSIEVKPGTEFGELAANFNSMSEALRKSYAALQSEIEERKRMEGRLVHDAFHDTLTELPNRALFIDRLHHVIESSRRHPDQVYAVLFFDLDRFKVVNDTLGHLVGDDLLVAVSERLGECLRPGDTVARLGGDEFGILLDHIGGTQDALQVADRIQKSLARGFDVDGHELFVSASIGLTLRSERYQRPEQVLRDADVAMYQAKLKGKACCVVFDTAMHGTVVDRLQLEADLRRAVEHGGEFLLHYQPILALRTGKLVGVEALVCWNKPGRGILDATDFIALAEESGAIGKIGEWALRTACIQLKEWHGRVPELASVTMSVNVSGRQFRRPEFVDTLLCVVRDSGIDPHYVAVDVKEGVIMDDVESSTAKLARLREAGVQIHVDDFGTGYSSLSYLRRFPITAVKIDRSFVAGLPSQPESEEVIKAIVSIAESLDFDVIAEGIEVQAQVERLEELRCRYGQGYLLSRPLAAEELERWVAVMKPRSVA